MAKRNLSRTDASDFERTSLEYVLDKERRLEEGKRISVDEAINSEALYEAKSERDETRVLFILEMSHYSILLSNHLMDIPILLT